MAIRWRSLPVRGLLAGMQPARGNRFGLWLGLVVVAICAAWATHARLAQWTAWQRQPALYLADGVPMMTTLDAYYALRLARLQAEGRFVPHAPVPTRHYARPEQGRPGEWYDQREPKVLPLLSGVVAAVAPLFGGVDRAAVLLPPLLSSLFMLPLFLACWRLGSPAAGLMGALVGTFCLEYYRRTSIGWLRTDALDLFFPWAVSALFLAMTGEKRRERLLLWSAAAGAVWYVFAWWYPKPGLSLMYAVALAVQLGLAGVGWRNALLCVVTFIVFAGPEPFGQALISLEDFAQRYLWGAATPAAQSGSMLKFPQVWSTITEDLPMSLADTLRASAHRVDLAVVGLAALLPWLLRRWRSIAALAPLLALGMLALVSSRRFIYFLAPWIGIGWGVLIAFVVRRIAARIRHGRPSPPAEALQPARSRSRWAAVDWEPAAALAAVLAVFEIGFSPAAVEAFVPPPAIPVPVFRDLQQLAGRLPANSRMWTWWDMGFAIVDTTGFGVYHDGAAQYTMQTNIVAASLVSPDPAVLHGLIRFVDREGNRGILREAARAGELQDLLDGMRRAAPNATDVPVYLLFTADMLPKFSAMQTLATPVSSQSSRQPGIGIRQLGCGRLVDDRLQCGRQSIDLRTGRVERLGDAAARAAPPPQLRRALLIERGQVELEREFADRPGLTIEIIMDARRLGAVYLLDESAYASNLNQMFLLGRYDAALFDEVVDHAPFTRVFRVRPAPG